MPLHLGYYYNMHSKLDAPSILNVINKMNHNIKVDTYLRWVPNPGLPGASRTL